MSVWVVIGENGCYEDRYEQVIAVAESSKQAEAFATVARSAKSTTLYSDGVFCRDSTVWDDVRVEEHEVGVLPEQSSSHTIAAASTDPPPDYAYSNLLRAGYGHVFFSAPLISRVENG